VNLTAQDRADVSLNGSMLSMSSATRNGITRESNITGGVLASFRFWVTSRNGFEFNYGHANDTQSVTAGGSKSSLDSGIHEISGLYMFRLRASHRIQPFLGAGAAFLQFNPGNNTVFGSLPQSQNKPGFLYTAGTDYMFNKHFGARLQFRGLVFAAPSYMVETFRSNTTHHMSEPTVGFVYHF
jgi:opacity protein-like surface antigen